MFVIAALWSWRQGYPWSLLDSQSNWIGKHQVEWENSCSKNKVWNNWRRWHKTLTSTYKWMCMGTAYNIHTCEHVQIYTKRFGVCYRKLSLPVSFLPSSWCFLNKNHLSVWYLVLVEACDFHTVSTSTDAPWGLSEARTLPFYTSFTDQPSSDKFYVFVKCSYPVENSSSSPSFRLGV